MDNLEHGTRGRYRKGCRCEACVKFARLYQAEWRARKKLREALAKSDKFPAIGETVYAWNADALGQATGYVLSQDLVAVSGESGKVWVPFGEVKCL